MSAQAVLSGAVRTRLRAFETMASSGALALALVLVGGLALGAALWYVAITHVGSSGIVADAALVIALAIGIAGAFAGWLAYGTYFARRGGVDVRTALRYDAPSWAALALYGAGLVVPVSYGGPSRAACCRTSARRRTCPRSTWTGRRTRITATSRPAWR